MPRLTKRLIDSLEPENRDYFIFDDEVAGFAVRVLKSGSKTFNAQYRAGGRTRRQSLGRYGTLTVEQARKLAKELLGQVAGGRNPAQERHDYRRQPTMADICARFDDEHIAVHLKPRTAAGYRSAIEKFIVPAIGTMKVKDVTRADIAQLHHSMRATPYQANRVLQILSKLFNMCELWCLRNDGSNPCRLIQKNPERKHERFLSHEEIARLNHTLSRRVHDDLESIQVAGAFRLLLLTGCRLREIQTCRWDYIANGYINLPDSKTGARRIPVTNAIWAIMDSLPREPGNPYLIIGDKPGQHVTDLQKPWRRIRIDAAIEDVRIHDLRHTYASHAVMSGQSLPIVAKLLGHTQLQTTMRYAHLADSEVCNGADAVSGLLATSMRDIPMESFPMEAVPLGSNAMGPMETRPMRPSGPDTKRPGTVHQSRPPSLQLVQSDVR